jgi:hypothetical protein
MQDLTFHRDRPGYYLTDTVGNVEFTATIRREAGVWALATYVCDRRLSNSDHRTLAEARAEANLTFRTVEVSA